MILTSGSPCTSPSSRTISSGECSSRAAADESGVAIVPEPVTALALQGVTCCPLVKPATTVELALVCRSDLTEPHLVRTVDVIRRLF